MGRENVKTCRRDGMFNDSRSTDQSRLHVYTVTRIVIGTD